MEINDYNKIKKTLNNVIFVNSCKKGLFPGTVPSNWFLFKENSANKKKMKHIKKHSTTIVEYF